MGMTNGGMGSSATCLRTTSEEMFLNALMNTALSPGTPTMEAASLGFLNNTMPTSQSQRRNSEELFNNWIATSAPESSNQYHNSFYSGSSSSTGNRPRQNSRRMSSELQAIVAQQNGAPWAPNADNVEQQGYLQTNYYLSDGIKSTMKSVPKPYRANPPGDKSGLAEFNTSGLLKNMWFSASSPMTRSRSSELRRRYAKLDGLPTPLSVDVFQKLATQGTYEGLVNHQPMPSVETFAGEICALGNNERHQDDSGSKQMGGPKVSLAPSVSCSVPVNQNQQIQQQLPAPSNSGLSDVVGLLKSSLDRKKMQTKQQQQQQPQQEPQQGMSSRYTQEISQQGGRSRFTQDTPQPGVMGMPTPMSSPQGSGHRQNDSLNWSQDHRQHIHNDTGLGQVQHQNSLGHAHSPDESSCGGISHSTGVANSDGPSNSAVSVHGQTLKHSSGAVVDQPSPKRQVFSGMDSGGPGKGNSCENGATKASSLQKADQLVRAGSITSILKNGFQLNEIDGATRKRRVERQRKMAEAKGRGNVPPIPADMQTAIKRCEALETEVRSLKLNLSFMNRKDSEQTKRIDEMEQHNEVLREERVRLMEELERVSAMNDPQ